MCQRELMCPRECSCLLALARACKCVRVSSSLSSVHPLAGRHMLFIVENKFIWLAIKYLDKFYDFILLILIIFTLFYESSSSNISIILSRCIKLQPLA